MKSTKESSGNSGNFSIEEVLKGTFLFSNIDDELLHSFVSESVVKKLPKGKILYLHEDKADFFYLIKSGWIKLFRETLDGEEAVIDVLNDGNIFGEEAVFDDGTYSNGAQVVEDATLVMIPINLLKQQIQEEPKIAMQMLSAMSKLRKKQDNEREHLNLQNAPQRIGCFLLRLCNLDNDGSITIHLPYDKTLIASRLGMKPETFSRALTRLRKDTGIIIKGATVQIDNVEELSTYSCRACSSSYPCKDLGE